MQGYEWHSEHQTLPVRLSSQLALKLILKVIGATFRNVVYRFHLSKVSSVSACPSKQKRLHISGRLQFLYTSDSYMKWSKPMDVLCFDLRTKT